MRYFYVHTKMNKEKEKKNKIYDCVRSMDAEKIYKKRSLYIYAENYKVLIFWFYWLENIL